MLNRIKISHDANNVWLVSDLHYHQGKEFLYKPRGFNSSEEHDEGVIAKWNEVCNEESVVIHCGDLCFNDPNGDKCRDLLNRLNFQTLYCLWGNHNSGAKILYREQLEKMWEDGVDDICDIEVYPLPLYLAAKTASLFKTVIFLPTYVDFQINGQLVAACHYPIVSHIDQGHNSWMICGHSHSKCTLTNKDTGRGKRLDVGWESFGRPVSFIEANNLLVNRDIDSWDHHSRNTNPS